MGGNQEESGLSLRPLRRLSPSKGQGLGPPVLSPWGERKKIKSFFRQDMGRSVFPGTCAWQKLPDSAAPGGASHFRQDMRLPEIP